MISQLDALHLTLLSDLFDLDYGGSSCFAQVGWSLIELFVVLGFDWLLAGGGRWNFFVDLLRFFSRRIVYAVCGLDACCFIPVFSRVDIYFHKLALLCGVKRSAWWNFVSGCKLSDPPCLQCGNQMAHFAALLFGGQLSQLIEKIKIAGRKFCRLKNGAGQVNVFPISVPKI